VKKVAVFFGGISPEHDVSVISGMQVMDALDSEKYVVIPVYVSTKGQWYTGDILRDRETYLPTQKHFDQLTKVTLDVSRETSPKLISSTKKLLGNKREEIAFDVAMPIFHGLIGEDGNMQGVFETANVPYTGMRTLGSAVTMDKVATKRILVEAGVPVLEYRTIRRPSEGLLVTEAELEKQLDGFMFPGCVKPNHLGSSIGVARVDSLADLSEVLPEIFKYDDTALLEPFVENLAEMNVAVRRCDGVVKTSAIEKPKFTDDLLDFKDKYMSSDGGKNGAKSGSKTPGQSSEGMLSLTRELNPELGELDGHLRQMAETVFEQIDGAGAPRLDFISNSETGEVWFNELNPIPGSYGFFLWEASKDNTLFSELLDDLISEAFNLHEGRQLPTDPTPEEARIFKRRS